MSKHFYHCPRCTFKGWVSGPAPTCRDCGVRLERRELVSADLERGEFGLVKWASKRARGGEAMRLTDFILECLVEHSMDIVRAEFKAGRDVSQGIAEKLNR
jgi:hypothetical protein